MSGRELTLDWVVEDGMFGVTFKLQPGGGIEVSRVKGVMDIPGKEREKHTQSLPCLRDGKKARKVRVELGGRE